MKNRVLLSMVMAGLLLLVGCDWFGSSKESAQGPVKLRIISILEKKYFDDAHIVGGPGVEIINSEKEDISDLAKNWDKNVFVVTYCSNYYCTASDEAAKKLKSMGFTNVKVYKGGIAEWYQMSKNDSSYKIEGPASGEAKKLFLDVVVANPGHAEEGVSIITAPELQKVIKEATLHV